jgi:hypothetical protein
LRGVSLSFPREIWRRESIEFCSLLRTVTRMHVHAGVGACVGAPAHQRFVSQFLIGLEALNVRLQQRRAQVQRP